MPVVVASSDGGTSLNRIGVNTTSGFADVAVQPVRANAKNAVNLGGQMFARVETSRSIFVKLSPQKQIDDFQQS